VRTDCAGNGSVVPENAPGHGATIRGISGFADDFGGIVTQYAHRKNAFVAGDGEQPFPFGAGIEGKRGDR